MFGAAFRVTFLLLLAVLLPRFLLLYAPHQQIFFGLVAGYEPKTQLGVASFNDFIKQANIDLTQQSVLLVTNQLHAKNSNHYLQMLAQQGVRPNLVYRSHNSVVQTKIDLDSFSLEQAKMRVKILEHLTRRDLQKVDLILIDLQNSGLVPDDDALADLLEIMQLSAQARKPLVLLDRPNPLGCLQEGPMVPVGDAKLKFKLPLRYGLTLGEVAGYANYELFSNQIKLTILPLKYYTRNNFNDFQQLQKVYTNRLFELIRSSFPVEIQTDCHNNVQCLALPEYLNFSIDKWYELRSALWRYHVEVVLCRYFDSKTAQDFVGVRLQIDDISRVSYLKVWQLFFKLMHEAHINARPGGTLEQVFGLGCSQDLIRGNLSADIIALWMQDLKVFGKAVRPYLIYRPWPIKVLL